MMNIALLLAAAVLLICVLTHKISNRFGIPTLLAFIALGMVFGSDGLLKIPFENYRFAEQICSIALIFIMFDGGFGMKVSAAKPVAAKAVLLSSLGVVLTALLTGLFCHLLLDIAWLESFLIGSVLGSTDAASVFSILRSKKLSMKYNTDSLLELESGSNDPFAYMLTVTILSIMKGSGSVVSVVYTVVAQILIGGLFGLLIAYGAVWFMRRFRFPVAGFDMVFVLGVALLSYAAPSLLGGNGYLSVYIVGVVLGNKNIRNKRELVPFFNGLTGLMQILIFFLLGLLAFPSQMPPILLPSLAIALFLTFVARPFSVFLILTPFGSKPAQQAVVAWAGLRGAASIVFAIIATVDEAFTGSDVFHIAFCVVLFSIALQGTLLPRVVRKLHMFDKSGNVFKTFTDYSEDEEVQLVNLQIKEGNPWIGKKIKEISLVPDMLIAAILRGTQTVVPNGETEILCGDKMVLSSPDMRDCDEIAFREMLIDSDSDWCGKPVSYVGKTARTLVVLIKREGKVVIPEGSTVILAEDLLVLHDQ